MRSISIMITACIWFMLCVEVFANGEDRQSGVVSVAGQNWSDTVARWISPTVRKHEADQRSQLAEFSLLPEYTPQSNLRAGFHSGFVSVSGPPEWVQVDLGQEYSIDTIAIVPSLVSIRGAKVEQYGFPKELRLQISNSPDFSDRTSEEFRVKKNAGRFNPYPLIYHPENTRGRYIRVLSMKHAEQDGMGYFALGELVVLSGVRNVAAWRPVTASSQVDAVLRWKPEYLVDQFSMLPPPIGAKSNASQGFMSEPADSQYAHKWVVVDLKREYPVEEVRIYPAQSKDNTHVPGWGIPLSFSVQLSRDATFEHDERIVDFSEMKLRHWSDSPLFFPVASRQAFKGSIAAQIESGEPSDLKLQSMLARYVRVYANRLDSRIAPAFLALGELQVYAEGKNVAKGADVIASDQAGAKHGPNWAPAFLVDGFSAQRNLVELPEWLSMIERREQLESEFGETQDQLERHRHRVVNVVGATLGMGFLGTIASLLAVNWRQRRRMREETEGLRSQIASDLHDDIGSNLGTIALISEMLEANPGLSGPARADLREIQAIAMETSGAMRDIIWILQPSNVALSDFVVRLRDVATRMLPGSQLSFDTVGCRSSVLLGIRWRRNVFLSIKEVVHNIAKHSEAEHVSIRTEQSECLLTVWVVDDGIGFDVASCIQGHGVDNVQKRMDDLGGKVEYESQHGTRVVLRIPLPSTKDGKPKVPEQLYSN